MYFCDNLLSWAQQASISSAIFVVIVGFNVQVQYLCAVLSQRLMIFIVHVPRQ